CDVRGTPHPDNLSYPNFFDFRSENRVFEHFVSYRDSDFSVEAASGAIHADGEIVSWDLVPLVGIRPQLGRGFVPEEETAGAQVVLLSHQLWQTYFGGDPNIIGRNISMNQKSFQVIGVMPPQFRFPVDNPRVQLWTTLAEDATAPKEFTPLTEQRGARSLDAMARLRPGVSIEQAHAQMDAIAKSLAERYTDDKSFPRTYVLPALETLAGGFRTPMAILFGAVALVLLIACANIANLLLARSIEREREFALRTALGASRATVVQQLLTESLLMGFLGCLVGVLFASASLRVLLPLAGTTIPRLADASIDSRVLGFSAALGIVTIVLFSLAPALHSAGQPGLMTPVNAG